MPEEPERKYNLQMVKFNSPVRYLRKVGVKRVEEEEQDPVILRSMRKSWSAKMFRHVRQIDPVPQIVETPPSPPRRLVEEKKEIKIERRTPSPKPTRR